MILLKILTAAVVITWASCTIGCAEVSTSATGGSSDQDQNQEKNDIPEVIIDDEVAE